MGLWWFCFIQWPLFYFDSWAKSNGFIRCLSMSFVCTLDRLYTVYMVIFAVFMPLPIILTITLAIRVWKKRVIRKQEIVLAIGSWVFSLSTAYKILFVLGGHLS
jgi:hypothetical protein